VRERKRKREREKEGEKKIYIEKKCFVIGIVIIIKMICCGLLL
jgi:hypothetical protein